MSFYQGAKKVLGGFLRTCFYRLHIEGSENMPKDGGVLVCSNHISMHDPIMIALSVERQVMFMAKKELFKVPLLNLLIKGLGAFPVDRKKEYVGALKKAMSLVKEGNAVGIFPQGTRHAGVEPEGTPVKSGAGMIALRSKCTVLPVRIETKKYKVLPVFKKICIKIGKPIEYCEFEHLAGTEGANEAVSEFIFSRITDLKS